jgi:hypothetical protein
MEAGFLATKGAISAIMALPFAAKMAEFAMAVWAVSAPFVAPLAALMAIIGLLALAKYYTNSWGDAFELMMWSVVKSVQTIFAYAIAGMGWTMIQSLQWLIRKVNMLLPKEYEIKWNNPSFDDLKNTALSDLGGDAVQQNMTAIMARSQAQREVADEQKILDAKKGSAQGSTVINQTNNISMNRMDSEDPVAYGQRMIEQLEKYNTQLVASPQK